LAWTLEFKKKATEALESMDRKAAQRIVTFLETRIITADKPWQLGTKLQGNEFEGLIRFRVGDYRVLAEIKNKTLVVLVVGVGHRREVYR
jgi:mRNA interferase RelE/StbE